MPDTIIEILVLCSLIGINALLVLAEFSVVSSRRARLEEQIRKGRSGAKYALEMASKPEELFSVAQLGVTLIGILSGVYGGATLAEPLADLLHSVPIISAFSGPIALGIVVCLITSCSIIIGELLPKRLAVAQPERFAIALSPWLFRLSRILRPLVFLMDKATVRALKLFGALGIQREAVTEDEIISLVEEGREAGVIEEEEQEIVERALTLGERRLDSLMTHRKDVIWLDLDQPVASNLDIIRSSRHTWYPVCTSTIDDIKGVLCVKDFWGLNSQSPTSLESFIHKPFFAPGATTVLDALNELRKTRMNIALIVDERGSFEGLVTLHDVASAVLGTLPERHYEDEDPIVKRSDGSWLVSGSWPVQDFDQHFGVSLKETSDQHDYQTVAGFIISKLGKIPKATDTIEWQGFRLEVVDMDGHRVDKILVNAPLPEAKDNETIEA